MQNFHGVARLQSFQDAIARTSRFRLNERVPRRPKPKYQMPRRQRGGFGWLIILILLGSGIYFFWRHEHPKKIVPTKTVVAKPQPKPFTVSRQSPADFPRPAMDVFEAQVALARRGISSGPIDNAIGSQTRAAISVFQWQQNLPLTGKLDDDTRAKLILDMPTVTTYTVTTNDLARLQPLGKSWTEKSQQSALDYETELELVAEKSHAHPAMIRLLNPNINWTNISAGTVLKIPDVNYPDPQNKAALVTIHLSEKFLEAFDAQTNLLVHFPCSIAAKVEKRPVGELHVVVV
ncbi:MAG TPA: peptidoglycan-binding protein, partial [Candidatus Baltobacteraceae bacterium]|nr:peptidoglycan-binding protein [Candidatus Baltobacteraceae bacterium]